ncbi:helix-turn-helix transcriptional regulator [Slackia exigua]|uniref:helix-turn-helix transcriptional regulator n=1 Tax=Slackia exigua TaxID=84109 RepID=UPI0028D25891|nr:helix-turn-helix transcriptional regulator [Slackia exigua]
MGFAEEFGRCIDELGCCAVDLSDLTGLSRSTISRYRNGSRLPSEESIPQLAEALVRASAVSAGISLADTSAPPGLDVALIEEISRRLSQSLRSDQPEYDYELFRERMNALIDALGITLSDLSNALNHDPSHLSRIRTGRRRPGDPRVLAAGLAGYISRTYTSEADLRTIEQATSFRSIPASCASDFPGASLEIALLDWLMEGQREASRDIVSFARTLDEFSPADYTWRRILSSIALPAAPFHIPPQRDYLGERELREGELDFLMATLMARNAREMLIYSDFPIETSLADKSFMKRWVSGVALLLKRGVHLDMVHCLDRPLGELIAGLEAWVPFYMTGQISGHYLPQVAGQPFHHLLMASKAAVLTGSCVRGRHEFAKARLVRRKKDVAREVESAAAMLELAKPLVKAFDERHNRDFLKAIEEDLPRASELLILVTSPPVFVMSDELLERILANSGVGEREGRLVLADVRRERALMESFLAHGSVRVNMATLSRTAFEERPVTLVSPSIRCKKPLSYVYSDYTRHIAELCACQERFDSLSVASVSHAPYRNLHVVVCDDAWAAFIKGRSPVTHFLLCHPHLVQATRALFEGSCSSLPRS